MFNVKVLLTLSSATFTRKLRRFVSRKTIQGYYLQNYEEGPVRAAERMFGVLFTPRGCLTHFGAVMS